MQHHNTSTTARTWYDSGHASLCLLGVHLRRMNFFKPLEAHVQIGQKVLKYTPVQKLEMFLVAVLAGAKAVSQSETTVRLDPALLSAFGLPGCAEQSSIAQTLNAATEQDVADLQAALGELFRSYSQSRQHDFTRDFLVLDGALSPLPESRAG
jgi:hypothetical protein